MDCTIYENISTTCLLLYFGLQEVYILVFNYPNSWSLLSGDFPHTFKHCSVYSLFMCSVKLSTYISQIRTFICLTSSHYLSTEEIINQNQVIYL